MRILAVGWENLASLSVGPAPDEPGGERLLRLDRPPLSQVGVFAITGPTGSGKTTILDAICLALFDATPRLGKRGGVKVGRTVEDAEIAAYDTRNLLRRGAGEGRAVCVFEGRDGQHYRATWSVRRARLSPSGRLQKVEMTLREEPDGAPIGRTNSEVQEEIRQRLGLDFDQFRRSVLLAQGEFAAFLAADGDERADLLEKVTGTALYARLGRETFERAAAEDAALALLKRDREALGALQPELRASLEQERGWLEFRAEQGEFAVAQATEVVRRAAELRRLEQRLAEAEAELGAAQAAWEAMAPQVARRERLRALKQHAPALSAWQRAGAAHRKAEQAVHGALARREQAAQERVGALTRWLAAARGELRRAEQSEAKAKQAEQQAGEAREAAAARLAGMPAEVQLAAGWAVTEQAVQAGVEAAMRLAGAASRTEALAAGVDAAQSALTDAERRLVAARDAVSAAEAAEAQARGALDGEEGARLQARHDEAVAAHGRVQRLGDLHGRAAAAAASSARWRTEAEAAAERGKAAAARAKAARAAREAALRDEPGMQAALQRARATTELAQHRSSLVDGEACPLCGAEEHPWADEVPEVDAILRSLGAELDRLRAAASKQGELASAAEAEASLAREQESRARQRGEEDARALAALKRSWAELAVGLDLAEPVGDGVSEALEQAAAQAGAELAAVRAALAGRRTQEDALAALGKAARQARQEHEAARRVRDATMQTLLRAQAAQQRGAEEQAADRTRVAAAQAALEEGDAEELARDPQATLDGLRARVAGVRRAEAEVESLARALEAATAAVARAGTEAAVARARLEAVMDAVGPEVAQGLEAEGVAGVGSAEAAARVAEQAMAAAERAVLAHQQACSARDERAEAMAEARVGLDEALGELGLDEAQMVEQALELPSLVALEQTLAAGEQRVVGAQSVLGDRRGHLDGERARRGPPLTEVEAAEVLWAVGGFAGEEGTALATLRGLADQELRSVHEALGRVQEQLARDDASVSRGAELDAAISAQARKAKVWATMRELIGDAQGKRFRSFAQSLTLDLLLAEANGHLEELEPRYRMERAPPVDGRALLALQVVDRDMGDEIRPTSSLSGGEGFLVSLALALALSSLSADGNTVGSLFIDEGFGTLDEKTLETALAVLEALQAGGRQVGIISHVQKLAENIGAQVIVKPESPGLSRVSVAGPGYS